MSWNKDTYYYKYKREDKFDYLNWFYSDSYDEDDYEYYLYDQHMFYDWYDFGAPKSMTELYQYRVLTLLHKLKLKDPIKVIDQIGWD